jgi:hypothetical protein
VAHARFARAQSLIGSHRVSPQMLALVHSGQALVQAHDGDFGTARGTAKAAVRHGRGAFDAPVVAAVLEDAAEAALLEGVPARAVMMLTAAGKVRGGSDRTRPWTARVAAEARAALDEPALAAATARGNAVTIDTVLELFE